MVRIIGEGKLKRAGRHDTVRRDYLGKKSSNVAPNHYLIRGRVYGHWADDWLTDWQTKNE